jgi:3-hydroxyacyl-CoA dehydrogenase/enoyl-CoA hydratase/3-hydroxybutyryl-CoA epimerase
LVKALQRANDLENRFGERFKAPELLKKHAQSGQPIR